MQNKIGFAKLVAAVALTATKAKVLKGPKGPETNCDSTSLEKHEITSC